MKRLQPVTDYFGKRKNVIPNAVIMTVTVVS